MKKLVMLVLLCMVSFSLLACESSTKEQTNDVTTKTEEKTTSLPEYKNERYKFKVLETKYFPANTEKDHITGDMIDLPVIGIAYEIENLDDEGTLLPSHMFMSTVSVQQEKDGVKADLFTSAFFPKEFKEMHDSAGTELKKGESVQTIEFFDVNYPDSPVIATFVDYVTDEEVAKIEIPLN